MRKSEPPSRIKLIEIVEILKPIELDAQYRDFGHYMEDYLQVQEAIYNTDQEEAINFAMQMQMVRRERE